MRLLMVALAASLSLFACKESAKETAPDPVAVPGDAAAAAKTPPEASPAKAAPEMPAAVTAYRALIDKTLNDYESAAEGGTSYEELDAKLFSPASLKPIVKAYAAVDPYHPPGGVDAQTWADAIDMIGASLDEVNTEFPFTSSVLSDLQGEFAKVDEALKSADPAAAPTEPSAPAAGQKAATLPAPLVELRDLLKAKEPAYWAAFDKAKNYDALARLLYEVKKPIEAAAGKVDRDEVPAGVDAAAWRREMETLDAMMADASRGYWKLGRALQLAPAQIDRLAQVAAGGK